jgi:hypothetical protein
MMCARKTNSFAAASTWAFGRISPALSRCQRATALTWPRPPALLILLSGPRPRPLPPPPPLGFPRAGSDLSSSSPCAKLQRSPKRQWPACHLQASTAQSERWPHEARVARRWRRGGNCRPALNGSLPAPTGTGSRELLPEPALRGSVIAIAACTGLLPPPPFADPRLTICLRSPKAYTLSALFTAPSGATAPPASSHASAVSMGAARR